jgi:hypothetical protein
MMDDRRQHTRIQLFDQEADSETRIEVVLPRKDGEMVGVAGQVRSCRNLGFIIHELGIEFDEPLDQETFAELAVIPQQPNSP